MNTRRVKALAKLALILGVPIGLVLGLFTSGVYVGVQNQDTIRSIERDLLGIDLKPTAAEQKAAEQKAAEAKSADTKSPDSKTSDTKAPDTKAPDTKTPDAKTPDSKTPDAKTPETPPKPDTPVTDKPVDTPEPTVAPRAPRTKALPLAVALPEPLDADLRARHSAARTIAVKVLVDPEVAGRAGDWLADVQYTVDWANQVFGTYFGIELKLAGVVLWNTDSTLDHAGALESLRAHPHEGADLVLGLRGQKLAANKAPAAPATHNQPFALAYTSDDLRAPMLQGVLVGISGAMGALPTGEADAGWMGGTTLDTLQLDSENRKRILERKQLPFSRQLPGDSEDGSK